MSSYTGEERVMKKQAVYSWFCKHTDARCSTVTEKYQINNKQLDSSK